jgi:hypothetical protein
LHLFSSTSLIRIRSSLCRLHMRVVHFVHEVVTFVMDPLPFLNISRWDLNNSK